MTRLDGEKKSPLPWIIGLLVLALLAAVIYYFAVAKGTDAVTVNENGVELIDNAPGGLGVENSADTNMTDASSTDSNAMDANAMDMNAMDANAMDMNSMDMNAMDANSAMSNGMMDGNSMDSNSAMMDNAVSGVPVPGMTPTSANNGSAAGNDTMATRSKTIKTDDKTVIYQKAVKEDGSLVRNKTIVPEPVQQAKKMQ